MKPYALILHCAFLVACSTNKQKLNYTLPRNNDINNIVKAIIVQGQAVYDAYGRSGILAKKGAPLCIDLLKLNVIRKKKDTLVNGLPASPPPPNTVLLEALLSISIGGRAFFNTSDSSYFFFLNNHLESFRISGDVTKNILTTTHFDHLMERMLGEEIKPYYSMSIPIFSADNKKAYVIVGFSCFLCGYGTGIYLSKSNGKWKIAKIQELWIS